MTSIVARIAWHECRVLWRDQRLRWATGILAVLLAIAGAVSIQLVGRRSAAIVEAQHEQREQWLRKRVSNAHVAAHAGITVFRPLHPLAIFDSGIDDAVGQSVFLEPHRRSLLTNSTTERSSGPSQFAELTIAFTLQTLVPLLIVLVTFTAIAAEREQGTLRLLASLGVRPRAIVLGKALGVAAPMLMVIVPAIGLGTLIVRTRSDVDASRAGLLLLTYSLYCCLLVGVGLFASARSRTTSGALIALLGFWLVTSVLVPRGAFAIAQRLQPAPTPEAFAAALEAIDQTGNVGFMQQRTAIERRLLSEYRVDRPSDLPVSTWGMTLYEREVESTARYNAEFRRIYDAYDRQQRLVDLISIAAPPLALRTMSMALSGSDIAHYQHFVEAAEDYRYELVQAMNAVAIESRLYNSSPTFADGPDQPAFPHGESTAYARVGAFAYHVPDARWVLRRVAVPAGALVAWSVVIGAALIWAVGRVGAD
jgi:ABC-2 type transport system permease protein